MHEPTEILISEIAITAELCNSQWSKPAAMAFAEELAGYNETLVIQALKKCRRNLKGRLTISEVVSRIDDGRPSAEEAWGMLPWNEDDAAALTDGEMNVAMGAARNAWQLGDKATAFKVFKQNYDELVSDARMAGKPPVWFQSLGYVQGPFKDRDDRDSKRITMEAKNKAIEEKVEDLNRKALGLPALERLEIVQAERPQLTDILSIGKEMPDV